MNPIGTPTSGNQQPTGEKQSGQTIVKPPLPVRLFAYRWLLAIATLALALDQLSKLWVIARMPLGSYGRYGGIEIFPRFFYIVHVGNTGAAWSMFAGMSTMLAVLAAATLAAIFHWRHHLGLRQRPAQVFFGLLIGGTIGNLCDRVRLGHVVDFLDFHFGSYIYPTFNIADSAILVGVAGYVLWSLRQPETGAPGN